MLIFQLISGQLPLSFFILFIVSLIMSIAVHEFAHAFMATKLGDPTAKSLGRLTLNPIAHLDTFGTLALLFIGIGWGKPVPFNPNNLKNPKVGSALISAAGPVSNLIIAFVISLPYLILIYTNPTSKELIYLANVYGYISLIVTLNAALAIFNLIPVHPLDGFKVLGGLLPQNWYYDWHKMERYGMFILLLLIIPMQGGSIISRVVFPIATTITGLLLPNLSILLNLTN